MNKELEEVKEKLQQLKEYKVTYYGSQWFKVEVKADNEMKSIIDKTLNYIDNSISKEVIREKIGELKSEYNRIVNQTGELIDNLIDFQRISSKIEVLQELLEEK